MWGDLAAWIVPTVLIGVPAYGHFKGISVYETFVEGAEEGLRLAAKLTPYLLAILFAFGLFRDSGALELLAAGLGSFLGRLGVPAAVLPLMLVRPLSGNASLGILTDLLKRHGPDSLVGRLGSTLQGSTDTTFYILSVYFGSVGIRDGRYSLKVGLAGDLAGFIASVLAVHLLFR